MDWNGVSGCVVGCSTTVGEELWRGGEGEVSGGLSSDGSHVKNIFNVKHVLFTWVEFLFPCIFWIGLQCSIGPIILLHAPYFSFILPCFTSKIGMGLVLDLALICSHIFSVYPLFLLLLFLLFLIVFFMIIFRIYILNNGKNQQLFYYIFVRINNW